MAMPSPICTVNGASTANGVNVTAGSTVTIQLASLAGVTFWSISCIGTDETNLSADITSMLVIDGTTKTATFTAPAMGSALIFKSQVNRGQNLDGTPQADFSITFGIYVLSSIGFRVGAVNETLEGDNLYGWVSKYNSFLRTGATLLGAAGGDLTGAFPNPDVVALTGSAGVIPISAAMQGATGDSLRWTRASVNVGGNTNVTLSGSQYNHRLIDLTGALTGNVSVIVPLVDGWEKVFRNRTTGNFALTIRGSSGKGVLLDRGEAETLYCNGTDVLRTARKARTIFNAKDYGAVGDGATDDTAAINAALADANAISLSVGNPLYSGGPAIGGPSVFLPHGQYQVTSQLEMVDGVAMFADPGTLIFSSDESITLLRIGGYYNTIDGLAFGGGRNHITIYGALTGGGNNGSPDAGGIIRIRNCTFMGAQGPSIYQDATVMGQHRTSSAALYVDNFDFSGASFFFGSFDGCEFSNGYLRYDATLGIVETGGHGFSLAMMNSGDRCILRDSVIVPTGAPSDRGALFQGSGTLEMHHVRFGGEGAVVAARTRNSLAWGGDTLVMGFDTFTRASVYLHACEMSSLGELSTIEIYDKFPAVIDIRSPIPIPSSGDAYDPALGCKSAVWIDSTSVSVAELTGADMYGRMIHLDGYRSQEGTRFRYGGDPLDSTTGQNCDHYLRQYFDLGSIGGPPQHLAALPQNNVSVPGILAATQGGSVVGNFVTNDTETGYTLNTNQPVTEDASHSFVLANGSYPSGWGGSANLAGEYCVSIYAKSTSPTTLVFGVDGKNVAYRSVPAGKQMQRYWFTFYHDGTSNHAISFLLNHLPSGSQQVMGLPMIHKGWTPAPYVYPVDSAASPTTNTTTTNYVPGVYYGTAAPSSGTYRAGDMTINTAPSAGSPALWIYTGAAWQAVGALATGSVPGAIQLANDLGGTAAAPAIVQLSGTSSKVTFASTAVYLRPVHGSIPIRGLKTDDTTIVPILGWNSADQIDVGDTANANAVNLKTNGTVNIQIGSDPSIVFGSGYLSIGTNPAASGNFRLPGGAPGIRFRKIDNSGDLYGLATDGSNNLILGNETSGNGTYVRSAGGVILQSSGDSLYALGASIIGRNGSGASNVWTLTNVATGDNSLTFQAPTGDFLIGWISGTASKGSSLSLLGQTTSGATGGDVVITPGAGATTPGQIKINGISFQLNVTPPSANPSGGGYIYEESGALKHLSPSGVITTMGAA